MQWFIEKFAVVKATVTTQISSPEFYTQIGIIVVALIVGWALAVYVVKSVRVFREEPKPGVLYDLRLSLHNAGELVQPVFAVMALGIASTLSVNIVGGAWLVQAAQGIALIFVLYSFARHLLQNATMLALLKWVGLPVALRYAFGWLDDVILHLESITLSIGNIEVSIYAVLRTFLFGFILFWFGRISIGPRKRWRLVRVR